MADKRDCYDIFHGSKDEQESIEFDKKTNRRTIQNCTERMRC